ncbi:hypothetical protein P7K49_015742 [Saguinus oedipus]|uniref:Uncharacterized protein n=1 Tax=Saguinus oedipus TaxID=9490 RepID=A0ABQ9VA35_SAGOE|nr:hypothetical protein P7K49_015742 [Saguinus oedipus]
MEAPQVGWANQSGFPEWGFSRSEKRGDVGRQKGQCPGEEKEKACFFLPCPPPSTPYNLASALGLGSKDLVCLAVPGFHDSDLMASMTRKLWDLEQQVKAQTDEILSKVGPQVGEGQGLV